MIIRELQERPRNMSKRLPDSCKAGLLPSNNLEMGLVRQNCKSPFQVAGKLDVQLKIMASNSLQFSLEVGILSSKQVHKSEL